jgi:hypothetical protein
MTSQHLLWAMTYFAMAFLMLSIESQNHLWVCFAFYYIGLGIDSLCGQKMIKASVKFIMLFAEGVQSK